MAQRRNIEPSQLRRKKRRRRNFKLIFWVTAILIIIFGLGFLTHLRAISINNITVKGNNLISSNDLIKLARKDMAGNYFFIFSKNNIVLYPQSRIEKDILDRYKQISNISINQTGIDGIRISLIERKPIALWCRETDCYFIDQTGYIFSRSPLFSGNVFFTYSGLITTDDPIGSNYLPADKFKDLNSFLDNVKKLGVTFLSLSASDTDDFDLGLQNGSHIFFSSNQSFDETTSNLQTVMDPNNPSGNSIDLSQIDYIDLRFGSKIIYKLKGSATTSAQTN